MDNPSTISLPDILDVEEYAAKRLSRQGGRWQAIKQRILPGQTDAFRGASNFSRLVSAIPRKVILPALETENIGLFLNGKTVDPLVFGDASGLLPLVVWRAEECINYCLNDKSERAALRIGSGSTYKVNDQALMGIQVGFDEMPVLPSAYLLMISEGAYNISDYIKEKAENSLGRRVEIKDFVVSFRQRIQEAMSQTPAESPSAAVFSGNGEQGAPSAAPQKSPTSARIIL